MKSTTIIASAAIAATTLLSSLHVCAETTTPRWGDVNADFVTDLSDAQLILTYYVQVGLGGREAPEIDITYADVNLDGSVDVSDAQLVLIKYVQEMSGLTYFLPAERGGTVTITAKKWYVYSAPSLSLESHVVDVVRPGESFQIQRAVSTEWFEVVLKDGETGYMFISKREMDTCMVFEPDTATETTTTTTTASETTTTATETTTTATETTTTATETTTTTTTASETTTTATETTTTATETTSQTETTVTTEAPKPKEMFSEGDVIVFQKTAWNVYDAELKGIIGWLRNGEELTIKSVKTLHDDVQLLEVVWVRDDEERQGFIYNGEAGFFVKK